MCRIGGRLGSRGASLGGAALEIPPFLLQGANLVGLASTGTVPGGQFDWGGRLLKGNGGAQRSPQADWKPAVECKGIRGLDCEADEPSRDESRA